jgi:hypothetical protein
MRKTERIPRRAYFYAAFFIGLGFAVMHIGAAAGY